MKVGLINNSRHKNPSYKTAGASGMDIKANIDNTILLQPGERISVPTGIFLEIPKNFEAQVRPRSGLALNEGITVLNTPGTIDSDYRGEILVILINHSKQIFKIEDGDRIAQLVINKVEMIIWDEINLLTKTKRDKGGFGSTGKK
jgi:dUTP pyrophosphatase